MSEGRWWKKGWDAYGGLEADWFEASKVERAQRVEVGAGLCIRLDRLPEWILCCGLVEFCSYKRQMSVIAFHLPLAAVMLTYWLSSPSCRTVGA